MTPPQNHLYDLGFNTVKELETESGILASAKNEMYGCIFGRDSLITSLKLLQVYKRTGNQDCLRIVRKSLKTLASLQGKEVNIESGEEPGKMIHEFRPDHHEHLTKQEVKPWYVYPDQIMRNYDTVDATPLFLITAYRYTQYSHDATLREAILPEIKAALDWILLYADSNGDGFLDYGIKPERKHGGSINQNWMDSVESTFHEDGHIVIYPLAPVEGQAYAYLALRLWALFFHGTDPNLAKTLRTRAERLKKSFNDAYIIYHDQYTYLASAIDGTGEPLKSIRSSIGHTLWASLNKADDGEVDGIVERKHIAAIVNRLLQPDMFEPKAGIRTLSTQSRNFQPNSYHNGSIWPHDNSIIAEGLDIYGYHKEAQKVRQAVLTAISHFNTPIELYVYWNGQYSAWMSLFTGQTASKQQAWSAAAILADSLALSQKNQSLIDSLPINALLVNLRQNIEFAKLGDIITFSLKKVSKSVPVPKVKIPLGK